MPGVNNMSEEYILVRVYKDVEVKNNDDYIENAIELATSDLGGFDVEIIDDKRGTMEQIKYKKWSIDHVYDCSEGYEELDYYNVWTPDGLDLAAEQLATIEQAKQWIDNEIKGAQ